MTLEERVKLIVSMCDREINRQEVLMRCAEHYQNEHEWLRRYDLQGVYMTARDILNGDYELEDY